MTSIEDENKFQSSGPKFGANDLETILKKSFGNETLHVVDFLESNFLSLGENFGSIIVKMEVKIRIGDNKKVERLDLVVKRRNPMEKPLIHWEDALRKEVFAYTKLFPMFKILQREAGYQENELIDLIPKYYGHRYSCTDSSDVIDDDSLFMLENLKIRGYYTGNINVGLDLDQGKTTIIALAQFHALGIALKQKKPEFFEEVVALTESSLGVDSGQLDEGFLGVLKNFRENPCFSKNLASIELSISSALNGKRYTVPKFEPWVSITHGDLWVNNILFRKNGIGKIDDVKLIDFQIFLHDSPLKDLPHFLCASLEDETLINHLDELLDVYYIKFTTSLKRLGCNIAPYSRDAYDKELKRQAFYEFSICSLIRKYFAFEIKNEESSEELKNVVFESECTDAMKKKLQVLIHVYEQRGWF